MANGFWQKYKQYILWVVDLIVNVAIVFAVVLLIEKFIATPFDIYGPSMCDTLNNINGECIREYGEKIILNKATYYVSSPERGDIIVFVPKFSDEKYFIKRIIGLPGETVEILNGDVYITNKEHPEGIKLDEPYLNEANAHKTTSFPSGFKIFNVPEGEYFTLGDNRNASTDSRSCFKNPYGEACEGSQTNTFVPLKNIEGKAWVTFWPLSKIGVIHQPEYFMTETDKTSETSKVPITK